MPKFIVQVCREVHQYRSYEVEADDSDAANEQALRLDDEDGDSVDLDAVDYGDSIITFCREVKMMPKFRVLVTTRRTIWEEGILEIEAETAEEAEDIAEEAEMPDDMREVRSRDEDYSVTVLQELG